MEGRELPVGWASETLGEVSEIIRGITFPASAKEPFKTDANICCLRTSNIQREIDWEKIYFVDRAFVKRPNQLVRPGDVLMSMANSYELVGKVSVVRELPYETAFGAFLSAVRPLPAMIDQFLFHFLRSETVQRQIREGSSQTTNIANVSAARLREIAVPLAPLNEQRRIAAKLDTTLAAVEACRQRLDGVAAILKRFRQAVLAAATSGELTREWRGERREATKWEETTFEAECEYITVGFVGKMADQYVISGVPFLRSLNVRPFYFDKENLAFISPSFHASIRKSSLRPGDLAIVRTGAPGQCCVIPESLPEANCSDLVIARPARRLVADYGAIVINSTLGQGFVKSEQVGVAQSHFNVGSMKRAPLQLPSIPEQHEIIRRAQELFSLADQLEAKLTTARKVVDRLTPALLVKAFRGELVPQDPNDEPASVLLERIRAARQEEAAAGKPARRGRRKAAAHPDKAPRTAAPAHPDLLAQLLQECGALSERALLAASELDPAGFRAQLALEQGLGVIRETAEDGQVLLEAAIP
ncbi:MAG: restriction endonuclease subunit S [Cyanobium sp. CZS 25K]|nr:restriction endonuclease subunit S [Cyanobium sp. CZS25K]